MSPSEEEKEWQANDQIAAAHSTNQSEPVATEPLQRVVTEKELNVETQVDLEAGDPEKKVHNRKIIRSVSSTTQPSDDDADAKSEKKGPEKRTWRERLNPLKTKYTPPIPVERQPSREYGANIFSVITFQWIAPLMRVNNPLLNCYSCIKRLLDWISKNARTKRYLAR